MSAFEVNKNHCRGCLCIRLNLETSDRELNPRPCEFKYINIEWKVLEETPR